MLLLNKSLNEFIDWLLDAGQGRGAALLLGWSYCHQYNPFCGLIVEAAMLFNQQALVERLYSNS